MPHGASAEVVCACGAACTPRQRVTPLVQNDVDASSALRRRTHSVPRATARCARRDGGSCGAGAAKQVARTRRRVSSCLGSREVV
jgi:hypothetical protein